MVAIPIVRSSNESIRDLPPYLSSPTAVFTGATQGIGLATLRQLATHTVTPTCYIVGRSEAKAKEIIDELKEVNGKGTYIFVKGDVALLESVDEVCGKIKGSIGKGKGIDMLFMSQGYLTLEGRKETREGLDALLSLRYYSRLRFVHNLLSLLTLAPNPHVVSVLAGGQEGKIYENDLELKHNYGFLACANHGTTMTTLAFEHLAKENPRVAFVHVYPGYVETNILQSGFPWPIAALYTYILKPLISFLAVPLPECGDRQLFHATSDRYPPLLSASPGSGVPIPSDLSVAEGSNGTTGTGFYIVGQASEVVSSGTGKLLSRYREQGLPEKVWRHTVEIFEKLWSAPTMTQAFVPILVLVSFLTAIGSLNYPVAATGTEPECWPGVSKLQPIIFKECLDTINQDLVPSHTDPDIPLKFSRDFRLNPDVMLPYFWKSQGGNCVVGVDFERNLAGYDRTSLNDIKRAAMAIARKCVISPPHLGGIVDPIGWQRKLTVTMGGFSLPADKMLNDTLSSE